MTRRLPRGYRNKPAVGPPQFNKYRDECRAYVDDGAVCEQLHKLCTLLEQMHAEYWRHIVDEHES